jgi:hypothetical protein
MRSPDYPGHGRKGSLAIALAVAGVGVLTSGCQSAECSTDGGGTGPCPGTPQWYRTCGYPLCTADAGTADAGSPCDSGQQVGKQCDTLGQQCDPGIGCGIVLVCATSDPTKGGCPISRRSAKNDIRYLTAPELEEAANKALAVPLAHFRYKDEAISRGPHLGFIIEDVGSIEGVDAPSGTVDLYGYTSLVLAAVQLQAHEIERLQARVRQLELEVDAHPRSQVAPASPAGHKLPRSPPP